MTSTDAEVNSPEAGPAGIERLLERGSLAVRELFAELQAQIVGLGPGVVEHSTGAYIGYRVAQISRKSISSVPRSS